MSAKSLVLWANPSCPYAQRVRITLAEMQLRWDDMLVESVADSPEFQALYRVGHPHGSPAIPLLQHFKAGYDEQSGLVLPESDVIVYYLAEEFPEHSVLPPRAVDRATVRLFIPLFMQELLPCIRKIFKSSTFAELTAVIEALDAGCGALEQFLTIHDEMSSASAKGPFVIGNIFSIAECVAAPHLQRLRLLPSPSIRPQMAAALLSRLPPEARSGDSSDPLLQFMQVKYPRLFEWANTVLSRDSVVSTFPSENITSVIAKVTSEWTE